MNNKHHKREIDDIYMALKASRQEPGVSLQEIAIICEKVFDKAEMEVLIKNLQNIKYTK